MKSVFTYSDFFSEVFCQNLLGGLSQDFLRSEILQKNGSYKSNPQIRNNQQISFENEDLAKLLLLKMTEVLFPFGVVRYLFPVFRIYKYEKGEYFKRHKDGSREEKTNVTILISLNHSFLGGRTNFWEDRPLGSPTLSYVPMTGSAVFFNHKTWHEGEMVTDGIKYVLRGDAYFEET